MADNQYLDKNGLFKKGNPGGGRPKVKVTDEDALTLYRNAVYNQIDPDEMARISVENAFYRPNKNGSTGSVAWAKLVFDYFIGPPAVRVKSEHVNVVEMLRLRIEEHAKEAAAEAARFNVVDVSSGELDATDRSDDK